MVDGNGGPKPEAAVAPEPVPLCSITIELQADQSCQVRWKGKFPNLLLLLGMLDYGKDEVKKVLADATTPRIVPPR